jgi:hypothetical protein
MGGPGSGSHHHYWRASKKAVVEECLSLHANRWMREGLLRAGIVRAGSRRWTYEGGDTASINYSVNTSEPAAAFVRLSYWWVWLGSAERESANYTVRLTTTRPRFGGLRWWFVCPLIVNGRPCNCGVGKLYLPPPARYFGCGHCHDLTYTSCQEHDKRVDALQRHPDLMDALLRDRNAPSALLLLAIKAGRKTLQRLEKLGRR